MYSAFFDILGFLFRSASSLLILQLGLALYDAAKGFFQPVLRADRISLSVQDHADVRIAYAQLRAKIGAGNAVVVHPADQVSRPVFRQISIPPC